MRAVELRGEIVLELVYTICWVFRTPLGETEARGGGSRHDLSGQSFVRHGHFWISGAVLCMTTSAIYHLKSADGELSHLRRVP
jgi:hypothetical protein